MSAFDPKRTSGPDQHLRSGTCYFSLAAPERGGREIADYIGLSHTSMTEMKAIGRWHVGFPRKRKSSAHAAAGAVLCSEARGQLQPENSVSAARHRVIKLSHTHQCHF